MSNNTVNKFIMPNGDEIKIDSGLDSRITNCLLEVPQRIKLELNNGTLTLKVGSQVIVPNGFEEDGVTPKFDYVDIESDLTAIGWMNLTGMVFAKSNERLDFTGNAQITSGNSATLSGGNVWYDTVTNTVKRCNDGSTWTSGYSFPICLATSDGSSTSSKSPFSSIDQVFNGMGYIGSTLWVDKGVKGLIPSGRNEDGILNNIEFKTEGILTTTNPSNAHNNLALTVNNNYIKRLNTTLYTYDEEKNMNYDGENLEYFDRCVVATYTRDSEGKVTTFQPKQAFRAVVYSDLKPCVVIIDSYTNGTSGYNVYSNGYCEQWGGFGNAYTGYTTKTITFLKKFKDTNYCLTHTMSGTGNQYAGVTNTKTVSNFSVINSLNYNALSCWKATGYLAEGTY